MARLLQDDAESTLLICALLHGEQDCSSAPWTIRGALTDREYRARTLQCAQVPFTYWRGSFKRIPEVSHLSPIVLRDLKDGTEALTALGLWALGPVLKV